MRGLLASARELPGEAWLMLLSLCLGSFPIGLLMVFFPLYLHDLGMHSFLIGGVFTFAGLGSSVLLLAIGPLADRFGRRSFLIAGTALPMLGFAIFALRTDMPWLIVASMLGGVGFSGGLGGGLVTATYNPMMAAIVPARLRTVALSWAEGAWTLSLALGSLIAGLPALLARLRLMPVLAADRAMFLLCLAVTLLAALLLLPVRERPMQHEVPARAGEKGASWDARPSLPLIAKLTVFFMLQGAGLGLVVQLLPLWFALRFNTSATAIAPWFSASQLVGLLTIPLVPWLVRRLGMASFIVFVAGASTLLLLGVPLSSALPLAGAFYVLRSALIAMQWPAQSSFLQGAVEPRVRGTATSITLGFWSIANALLPALAGYLLDRRLLDLPLLLGILCYGLAALWFYLALRHTPLPEETPAHAVAGQETADSALVAR